MTFSETVKTMMDTVRGWLSLRRVAVFYAILSGIFYISVLTGCSLQLTLHTKPGEFFVASSVLLMVLSGICVASSFLLLIGILVESSGLVLFWLIFVFLTNVYTVAFTFVNLDVSDNQTVLTNMAFDVAMAIVFLVGFVFVAYAYFSIRRKNALSETHIEEI